jgi:hypothetical protein
LSNDFSWLPDGSTGDEGRLLNGEELENMLRRELVLLAVVLLVDAVRGAGAAATTLLLEKLVICSEVGGTSVMVSRFSGFSSGQASGGGELPICG